MPVYEYEHKDQPCEWGKQFEVTQSIREEAHKVCPHCGGAVKRLISLPHINTPTSDSELKSMGFTKLVKRDQGVYENVTRSGSESRYMEQGNPASMPDLKRKISD